MRQWVGGALYFAFLLAGWPPALTQPFAYITNFGNDAVTVIDTATDRVTTSVHVGDFPHGVAVSPDGSRVLVGNVLDQTVSILDATTNVVLGTVSVGGAPDGIAITPDGRGFVGGVVIDIPALAVIAKLPVGGTGVAASSDGARVYVTSGSGVAVIDTASLTVIDTIAVGSSPHGIAVTPDGRSVYVANSFDDTVSVIDTATRTVVATVDVGDEPTGVAIAPNGLQVFVTNSSSNTISVIERATNSVVDTVAVGSTPFGISVTPDSRRVFFTRPEAGAVDVMDASTHALVDSIGVSGGAAAFGNFIGPAAVAEVPTVQPANFVVLALLLGLAGLRCLRNRRIASR